jgi:fructose-bisphosphate aldolase class II
MTTRDAELDLELLHRLAASVAVPLVLHGSSGVADDQLRLAVDGGIRKVNVGTALNVSYTGAIRESLSANPSAVDPRRALAAGRRAIGDTVADLCRVVAVGEVGTR